MARSWILWELVLLVCFYGLVLCKGGPGQQNNGHEAYSNNDVNNVSPKSTSSGRINSKSASKSYITINTKQGKLKGVIQNSKGIVHTGFLGVPYAVAPIGELRFKDPVTHPGWSIPSGYEATQYKPGCLQGIEKMKRELISANKDSSYLKTIETDEDCLYLNVYIPRNLSRVEHINTLSLPVMIFIHGWDFENEFTMLHEGWKLAAHGDVIVATVSYRVGVFGFFSLLNDEARGNFGLLDQKKAMHWIWDNIREFGGNPEKITIFGGSSGGSSVGFHMISPQSRGLFVKAISQSGNALSPNAIQHQPKQAAYLLSESLKCPTNNYFDMLTCLRKVPGDHLLQTSISIIDSTWGWLPVVDGVFLPEEPRLLLERGKYNPVDYLIGFNNFDGYVVQDDLPYDLSEGISQDEYEDLLSHFTRRYITGGSSEHIEKAVMLEYSFCSMNATQRGHNIVHFVTDLVYASPAELVSRLMTKSDERMVYLYEFSHRPVDGTGSKDKPRFVQASHNDELPFVFGMVGKENSLENRLSNAIMSAWTNFAKTGNPNPVVAGLFWEPYTVSGRKYVEFTSTLSSMSSKSHLRPREIAFWNDYVFQLRKTHQCSVTRDQCERATRPVRLHEGKVSSAMWALAGICFVLMCLIVLLCLRLWLPIEVWKRCTHSLRCCPTEKEKEQEAERKKLHPLPYFDEPT